MKINKEELIKKAIKGGKSLIVAEVIKYVTNEKNRKKISNYLLDKVSMSISESSSNQYLYGKLCLWIYKLNNKHFNNNVNIRSDDESSFNNVSVNENTYMILYKNSLLMIECEKEGVKFGDEQFVTGEKIQINIIGKNSNLILNEIKRYMSANYMDDMIKVRNSNFNDRWIIRKPLNTIYSDQIDKIVDLINKWKSNKEVYEKNAINFKTGLLLYGKPGTGKTSIAKAIATEFNMNIQYINLAACKSNALSNLYLCDDSVILLEEIDLMNTESKEEDNPDPEYREKLSTLLNVLDGVDSPNNNIIIATTNKLEDIDERLLRPGRFSEVIEITDICKETATKMCEGYGLDPNKVLDNSNTYNPSELQNKILKMI